MSGKNVVEAMRALLRGIADDCENVSRDDSIDNAERRAWRAMARKAAKAAQYGEKGASR